MTVPIRSWTSTASGSVEMRYLNGPTGQLVDAVIARETPAARSPGICLIGWARSAI